MYRSSSIWVFAVSEETAAAALEAAKPILRSEWSEVRRFLNGSAALDPKSDESLSPFSLPAGRPEQIIISSRFPFLLASPFTLAWLAELAQRAELLIANLPPQRSSTGVCLAQTDLLAEPETFALEDRSAGWTAVTLAPTARKAADAGMLECDLRKRFPTTWHWFSKNIDEFRSRYVTASASYIDKCRLSPQAADAQLIYTLHGVLQKGLFLQRRLEDMGIARTGARILDMGGGYGALAVEMALLGHHCTVLELEQAKIKYVGSWLSESLGVRELVRFRSGAFRAIDEEPGPFDVICFFGALLYEDRPNLPGLLTKCRDRLTRNGRLFVHETPKVRAKPDARDYQRQFEGEELDGLLRGAFSDVRYFSIFSMTEIDSAKAGETLLLAEARP